ncbi:MAG: hypothetical protein LBD59_02340 [Prevotellaceae bacterium]|nr:hypothetical protein [Prevotellaceae bacterium]
MKNREPSVYSEGFAVVREASGSIKFFSGDDGSKMVPENNVWNQEWGNTGDRVYVRFNYNPYAVSDKAEVYVSVQSVTRIRMDERALDPTTVDADTLQVPFLSYGNYDAHTKAIQGFLTVLLYTKYANPAKHSFGFLEESNLTGHDTLFLKMWHSSRETAEPTSIGEHLLALKIDSYVDRFYADTVIIALKYNAEGYDGAVSEKTIYAKYGKSTW